MNRSVLVIFFSFILLNVNGQFTRHIVQFTYKGSGGYSLSSPNAYLSGKALQRRARYNIAQDSTDLPVNPAFIDSLRKAGNVTILSSSRWLNQALIQTTDASALSRIARLPFVRRSTPIGSSYNRADLPADKFADEKIETISRTGMQSLQVDALDYGNAYGQIHIHEGEYLHNAGFQGQGITIAMLDGGYQNFNNNRALDSIRNSGRLLGTWDFVKNESSVSEDHPHGLYCLSIMAANLPGLYVGSAPKASYYLFRTEDTGSEFPVEEHYWAVAAEQADSLGVDMISSSLGYSEFDQSSFNYTYAQMDGNTTMVTRAADLAAKKGILVCNSAGNSGGDPWKYIIAPADGDSVLAIGATNVSGAPAWFTSFGPSADGRVKPDVASVGDDTYVVIPNGAIARGDGTSFSNPNLAGLIACLWQAFPEFNNMEIIDAVKRSSSRYTNPDNRIGYGIPNMRQAYQYLLEKKYANILREKWVKVFPNPLQNESSILIRAREDGAIQYQLMDMSGRLLRTGSEMGQQGRYARFTMGDLGSLPTGVYILKIINGKATETIRLLK